ncbi:MAG: protein phosphatase CheZ [Alphaproteobacteria bacterium]
MEDYKIGMEKVAALKVDMAEIQQAINSTKQEISSLHHTGFSKERMSLVNDELGEVVDGTEKATEVILTAAEEIDNHASDLSAKLDGNPDQGMAAEIQDSVVKIFEACNFQDVTGQRINKVVNTLRFVDERVSAMMEIWGGIDAFNEITPQAPPNPSGDDALLHGPGDVDEDPTRASQNDIDALFD